VSEVTQGVLLGWSRERLNDGQTLGRYLASVVSNDAWEAGLVVDGTPDPELRWGRGGRAQWARLADLIIGDFPSAVLVVELPLVRPGDLPAGGSAVHFCDGEAFAVTPVGDGKSAVVEALSSADPSSLYVVAIVQPDDTVADAGGLVQRVKHGAVEVLATVVGAYDGEGFIYCRRTGAR
jgi:hypothetical protein